MLSDPQAFAWPADASTVAAGTQLLRRACVDEHVLHIDSGRVALGVVENGALAHQMGLVEGPAWLNVGCAVLDKPPVVDAVADGPVQLRRVPLRDFVAGLRELPAPALALLRDMAAAHRQRPNWPSAAWPRMPRRAAPNGCCAMPSRRKARPARWP